MTEATEEQRPDAAPAQAIAVQESRTMESIPFKQAMLPRSMKEGMDLAVALSRSTLVPKDFVGNPANVFLALQLGMELGLPPMQALQSIAVINGRPTMWGDAVLALVWASGKLDWITEDFDESDPKNLTAVCTVQRKGAPKPRVQRFSEEDAKAAGLLDKQGPWKTYKRRMLQMRARGFALRDTMPDVLRGIITTEEAEDIPSVGSATVTPESTTDAYLFNVPEEKQTEIRTLLKDLEAKNGTMTIGQRVVIFKKHEGKPDALIADLRERLKKGTDDAKAARKEAKDAEAKAQTETKAPETKPADETPAEKSAEKPKPVEKKKPVDADVEDI